MHKQANWTSSPEPISHARLDASLASHTGMRSTCLAALPAPALPAADPCRRPHIRTSILGVPAGEKTDRLNLAALNTNALAVIRYLATRRLSMSTSTREI